MGTDPQGQPPEPPPPSQPEPPPPSQEEMPPPFEPDYEIITLLERGEDPRREEAFRRAVRERQEHGSR